MDDVVEITANGVDWAGEWSSKYENERDHHSQKSRRIYWMENIISVNE
jgi:hypothetical protein